MSRSGGGDESFSLDRMMKSMPKFFQMADDMHSLTGYINDMRIIMIFLIVAGAVGGAIFLLIRHNRKSNKYRLTRKEEIEGEVDCEHGWTKSMAPVHGKNGHSRSEKTDGDHVGM